MRWIDYVAKVVERYPDTLAVICHGEQLSYAQLWEAVGKEALRLRDIEHIQEGQYYVQACTQDIAYVVRFLALHLIGARCDILYTTGSTGKPKAVLLSDEGMIANGERVDLCDMRPLGPFRTLEQDASRIYDRWHAAYS